MAKLKFNSPLERKFAKECAQFINQAPEFSLERAHEIYDFTLYFQQIPIAVIEVVGNLKLHSNVHNKDADWGHGKVGRILNFAKSQNIEFFVLTDTNSFLLWQKGDLVRGAFDNIASIFKHISKDLTRQPRSRSGNKVQEVADVISSCIRTYNSQGESQLSISKDDILQSIYLQGEMASFAPHEMNDWHDLETRFFSELLDTSEIKTICKYTALSSAFMSLETQKIRLNGIVGMNDTTETHYADHYIGRTASFQTLSKADVDELNRTFIYSCTASEDDLTMWRLYADDCRGVSIKFSLSSENSKSFIVKKVSYAKADGTHAQLELIKQIKLRLEESGIKFIFRGFGVWKHFFKPYDYSVEKEIRILHLADQKSIIKWNLTASHQILNPYVLLPLGEFPAKLIEIMLGSKCPDLMTNLKQFESFLRMMPTSLPHAVLVGRSKISNYR